MKMRAFDRFLQRWRIRKVRPYLSPGLRVLDIGCADGALFEQTPGLLGIGIDPELDAERASPPAGVRLVKGLFPQDLPDQQPFDAITLLAVLEHIRPDAQPQLARDCARFLKPGGRLLLTVPSVWVDPILHTLRFLRIMDAETLEQHYGFRASQTPGLFGVDGLKPLKAEKFQLGLNNFFVFQKG